MALPWGALCGACLLGTAIESERFFVGDYERFQPLGEGAMGTVYLARHVASDEIVALKLAKRELMDIPGGAAFFASSAEPVG